MGKIEVYIGPNGFGKTTKLNTLIDDLINNGISEREIFYMPAEIYLDDEIKETDTSTTRSKTMEFLLTDILDTDKINAEFEKTKKMYEQEIEKNSNRVNGAFDEVAKLNGNEITSDIIEINKKISVTKPIQINSKEFKAKIGSGQKYYFFLQLLKESNKKYIFIDEPEQYSHPTLLNKIAKVINSLVESGKSVYIASHSPRLLSMLNLEISDIKIINDHTHKAKTISISNNIEKLDKTFEKVKGSWPEVHRNYYEEIHLRKYIKEYYYKDFLEALFTKNVILCEGNSDKVFINKVLSKADKLFEDYHIFMTNGKFNMPIFVEIFLALEINTYLFYDDDTNLIKNDKEKLESKFYMQGHDLLNDYFKDRLGCKCYGFEGCLEKELVKKNMEKTVSNKLLEFLDNWEFETKYDIFNF
ncbi:ATP-dependent nuclease [Erysipelothrix tonsillarum]|uniref:ATP-dependent nuclease n=1 Tax=Erysipelothrix tonsillarum TaxID=38402 RepID=UPI00036B45AD|nr:TOPRIM nucleotidyl transferase/hydrolase domain-containing protein [Erysipelothrix tonsillarum]